MIELGLQRISALLKYTPQRWKAIHVAGTNGKGSICAYLSAMLYANDVHVGRYTSPHLIDRWDCITIGEEPVHKKDFVTCEALVRDRNKRRRLGATEFELLTATAFEVFHRKQIDAGVIEVGLGGRLDATNAMAHKDLTVISKIGLDHQSFLGNTIEEIAREKAGIMRTDVPCVLDSTNDPAVIKVIEDYANEIGTQVVLSSPDSPFMEELSKEDFEPHQWQNLACAYAAVCTTYTNFPSPLHRALPFIKMLKWPARLQLLDIKALTGRNEPVLLDGAHNIQSAEVLGRYVFERMRGSKPSNFQPFASEESRPEKVTWVLAASQGKELGGILGPLIIPGDCVAAVQFGPVDGMPWVQAMETTDILAAVNCSGVDSSHQYNAGTDISSALRWAVTVAAGGPIVIAGSLYLASDVLRLLRDAEYLKK
jgi:folylpolyglutamate synthase/dihydrofolate synthase